VDAARATRWTRQKQENQCAREDDMPSMPSCVLFLCTLIFACTAPPAAYAQGSLVIYCGVNEEWCRAAVTAFERETGIKVAMTRKSSGEIYAQIKAEAANP